MAINIMSPKSLSIPKSIGRQLIFAASAASAVGNRILEDHGLTLAQWAVLQCLWRNGELSVKDISRLTGNTPPAASRIVDRMVAAGLLLRRQNAADRRGVTIALSERAEGMRELTEVFQQVNDILLSDLTETEAEQLFDLLARTERAGRDWLDGA